MLVDMINIISIMTTLRKTWQSGSGKGGQDFNNSAFTGLIKGIKKQIAEFMD